MDPKEEDSVTIEMTVSEDRKSFEVKVRSTIEMTDADIVLAMECWIRDSLLEGYDWEESTH